MELTEEEIGCIATMISLYREIARPANQADPVSLEALRNILDKKPKDFLELLGSGPYGVLVEKAQRFGIYLTVGDM